MRKATAVGALKPLSESITNNKTSTQTLNQMKTIITIASLILVGFASAKLMPKPVAVATPVVVVEKYSCEDKAPEDTCEQFRAAMKKADANVQVKIASKKAAIEATAKLLAPYEARVLEADNAFQKVQVENGRMLMACEAKGLECEVHPELVRLEQALVVAMERLEWVKQNGVEAKDDIIVTEADRKAVPDCVNNDCN